MNQSISWLRPLGAVILFTCLALPSIVLADPPFEEVRVDEREVIDEANRLMNRLDKIRRGELTQLTRATAELLHQEVRLGLVLIHQLGEMQTREGETAEGTRYAKKASQLIEKIAGKLDVVAEAFADPLPRVRWSDFSHQNNKALRVASFLGSKTLRFFQWVGRDIGRALPIHDRSIGVPHSIPIPFIWGRDDRRTQLMKRVSQDLLQLVVYEGERALEGRPSESLVQLRELTSEFEKLEPVQYGRIQKAAEMVYWTIVVPYMFSSPPIDIAGFPERTTYSPLVSALMWTSAAMYLGFTRRQSSGLPFYENYGVIARQLARIEMGEPAPGLLPRMWDSLLARCGFTRVQQHTREISYRLRSRRRR